MPKALNRETIVLTCRYVCPDCISGLVDCTRCPQEGDRGQCRGCGGIGKVDCPRCVGDEMIEATAEVELGWFDSSERVHQIATWMDKNGYPVRSILELIEKPYKWGNELVLAINGINDVEPK